MRTILLAGLCWALLPLVHAQLTSDPCSQIFDNPDFSFGGISASIGTAKVMECYQSFPIDPEGRRQQVNAVKKYYDMYVYKNIAKNAGDNLWPSNVDIFTELDKIASDDSLNTEYNFQESIRKLITSLYDAHTKYSPQCFSQLFFLQPLTLSYRYESESSTSPTIYFYDSVAQSSLLSEISVPAASLKRLIDNALTSIVGSAVSNYTGYIVERIDGVDAAQAIQNYADTYVGLFKDPSTRFTASLNSYSFGSTSKKWQVSDGLFAKRKFLIPNSKSSVTYQLKSPTGAIVTVDMPWLTVGPVKASASLNLGHSAYYNEFCKPDSVSLSNQRRDADQIENPLSDSSIIKTITHIDPIDWSKIVVHRKNTTALSLDELDLESSLVLNGPTSNDNAGTFTVNSKPLYSDGQGAFYKMDDTTCVWMLSKFSPANKVPVTDMLQGAITGLLELDSQKCTNLIIDVSGNAGGIVVLGEIYIQLLFPTSTIDFLALDGLATKTKKSLTELYTKLVKTSSSKVKDNVQAAFYAIGSITSITDKSSDIKTVSDLYNPGQILKRGGVEDVYSNRFFYGLKAVDEINSDKNSDIRLTKGWSYSNIAIVSDGFCGSTCGQFVRVLRDSVGVKTYTFGGPKKKAFQPTGFEAGAVADFPQIVPKAEDLPANIDKTGIPSALPLPVDGSMAWWESYSLQGPRPDAPLEYVPSPSDEYIFVSDPLDSVAIWKKVAAQMPTTNPGSVDNPNAILPRKGMEEEEAQTKSSSQRYVIYIVVVIVILIILGAAVYVVLRIRRRAREAESKIPQWTEPMTQASPPPASPPQVTSVYPGNINSEPTSQVLSVQPPPSAYVYPMVSSPTSIVSPNAVFPQDNETKEQPISDANAPTTVTSTTQSAVYPSNLNTPLDLNDRLSFASDEKKNSTYFYKSDPLPSPPVVLKENAENEKH